MTDPLIDLPTDAINALALPRDRSSLDRAALEELKMSISVDGLRQPIEVWALSTPAPPFTHGLISGLRRLPAHRELGLPSIPAFLRDPASVPSAMASMVAENEIRAQISPWEKGRLLVEARDEGLFETIDAAVAGLYPLASSTKRTRLRSIAMAVETFSDLFHDPTEFSQRQVLRLASVTRTDLPDLLATALSQHRRSDTASQWQVIEPIVAEAESILSTPQPRYAPGRPRRTLRPRPGILIRREMTRDGWTLRFTGPEATGLVIEQVFDELERWLGKA